MPARPVFEIFVELRRYGPDNGAALLRHDESGGSRVVEEEGERWRRKWPLLGAGQDPFYSPHLRADKEEPALRLDKAAPPEDNSR